MATTTSIQQLKNFIGPKAAGAWPATGTVLSGNSVLNGVAAPVAGNGVDGDFFFNTATQEMYGPKSGGAWGTPFTLKGSIILSGVVDPVVGDGQDNDYYLNTVTKELFGPKSGGVWPAGGTILSGNGILNGAADPVAGDGKNDDYYFNTVTKELFGPKVAGAWPATGTVLSGSTILNGIVDPVAGDGADGDFFLNTVTNTLFGPKGLTTAGVWDPSTLVIKGNGVLNGIVNPVAGDGDDGDFFINTATQEIFGPKGATTPGVWDTPGTSIKGNNGLGVADFVTINTPANTMDIAAADFINSVNATVTSVAVLGYTPVTGGPATVYMDINDAGTTYTENTTGWGQNGTPMFSFDIDGGGLISNIQYYASLPTPVPAGGSSLGGSAIGNGFNVISGTTTHTNTGVPAGTNFIMINYNNDVAGQGDAGQFMLTKDATAITIRWVHNNQQKDIAFSWDGGTTITGSHSGPVATLMTTVYTAYYY
ncbi:MAG: hypothetical protein HC798_02700 [Polaribacter sp.]|nr:hypothetical protein [Polaribacter sp.]